MAAANLTRKAPKSYSPKQLPQTPFIATSDAMQTWASSANQAKLGPWSGSSWRGTYCGATLQKVAQRADAAFAFPTFAEVEASLSEVAG